MPFMSLAKTNEDDLSTLHPDQNQRDAPERDQDKKTDNEALVISDRSWENPSVGSLFDNRYRIVRPLGQGGMGNVFLAEDQKLSRFVALKIPRYGGIKDADLVKRFRREARVAAQFEHPHLCPVFDVGETAEGVHYLTMPFVEGEPLATLIANGPLDPAQAITIVRAVASGLAEAHRRGITHRDLKPFNILMKAGETPVVVDFGLARHEHPVDSIKTDSNSLVGSPHYMAPEQINTELGLIGPPTDVHALGLILFELLIGSRPYPHSGGYRLILEILKARPKPPSTLNPDVDPRLDPIILKALAKDPADRYQSAQEFADVLGSLGIEHGDYQQFEPNRRVRALGKIPRRSALIGSAVLGVLLLVIFGLQQLKRPPKAGEVAEQKSASNSKDGAVARAPAPVPLVGTEAGQKRSDNGLEMAFRWCPPGSFQMGSPTDEVGRYNLEDQVEVTLTEGFWIAETEVTQSDFERLMGINPSYFSPTHAQGRNLVTGSDTPSLPVESVSWYEGMRFCAKLTEQERKAGRLPQGWIYTLPTEAQWEYACRAGTTTATAFGIRLSSEQANFQGFYPYNGAPRGEALQRTTEVSSYPPNNWGIVDMHGNVWEWCLDGHDRLRGGRNPIGSPKAAYRVLKGGAWSDTGAVCRSAIRRGNEPNYRFKDLGFRPVITRGESE